MLGLTETSARSRPSALLAVGAPKLRSEREGLGMEGGVGLLWNATLTLRAPTRSFSRGWTQRA